MTTSLIIGDPHFHTTNIPEIEEFTTKLLKFIETKSFDFIVILGDVLHEHEKLHTIPLNKAYSLIDKLRKHAPTFVLVGNHDMINHQQFLSQNHWMNALKKWNNVTIVDTAIGMTINDNYYVFCPYVAPGRFIEALDTISDQKWKQAKCIFAHQEFYGCKMGAIVSTEGDKWSLEYPYIISGHIHSRQKIQENIFYPGASLQQAFGESEKNIIAIAKFSENSNKIDEIDLELPRKRIVYMDVENMETYQIPDTKDKLKLTIKGNYEQFKVMKKSKKFKELLKSGVKIVYKHHRDNNIDISETNEDNTINKFQDLLYKMVLEENNEYLVSDFNYVFLNKNKDSEILLI